MNKIVTVKKDSNTHNELIFNKIDETISYNDFMKRYYCNERSMGIDKVVKVIDTTDLKRFWEIEYGHRIDFLVVEEKINDEVKRIRVNVTGIDREFHEDHMDLQICDIVHLVTLDYDGLPNLPKYQ